MEDKFSFYADNDHAKFNPNLDKSITFMQEGKEMLRIGEDGKFYVRGKEVPEATEGIEIYKALLQMFTRTV